MNYSATTLPEHLKSGGIPPFSGCIHDTTTACLLAIQLLLLFLNFLVRKAITFWTIPPFSPTVDLDSQKKEKKNTSQMRLGSVFKMRMSILNTATTEHLGCILFSSTTKSTNQNSVSIHFLASSSIGTSSLSLIDGSFTKIIFVPASDF